MRSPLCFLPQRLVSVGFRPVGFLLGSSNRESWQKTGGRGKKVKLPNSLLWSSYSLSLLLFLEAGNAGSNNFSVTNHVRILYLPLTAPTPHLYLHT